MQEEILERKRCFGEGPGEEFYAEYHDEEWGVPCHDEWALFELLILEGAQAGLSWKLILRKREGYRKAFYSFDPQKVATMTDKELNKLTKSKEIVPNRLKIFSTRKNARVFLSIQKEWGSFDAYVWSFVEGKARVNHWKAVDEVPCVSAESIALSKDLKKRGMSFVGPKICYSFMQACGMVNDHLLGCPSRQQG